MSGGLNRQGMHEHAKTYDFRRYAPSKRCPSCNAPIVATNPTDFFWSYALLRHSLYDPTVGKSGMEDCGSSDDMFLRSVGA